ncbi:MAG: type II toxin-antitoxin system RelE/ParE family toxin [Symploca sp. SIO2C1]|nr:type II toxin-antitoxin system RelE/ParE family toxin [Symploca sp. SIO2C1]
MTKAIVIRPRASQDLDEHFAYIAQNNPDLALKFFDAVRQTFAKLAQMSGMGSAYPSTNPRLEGLRKWPVKGFKKHQIFYLSFDNYIEIVRILHAARDIEGILEKEEGE